MLDLFKWYDFGLVPLSSQTQCTMWTSNGKVSLISPNLVLDLGLELLHLFALVIFVCIIHFGCLEQSLSCHGFSKLLLLHSLLLIFSVLGSACAMKDVDKPFMITC